MGLPPVSVPVWTCRRRVVDNGVLTTAIFVHLLSGNTSITEKKPGSEHMFA
jgi:hypothetical protein